MSSEPTDQESPHIEDAESAEQIVEQSETSSKSSSTPMKNSSNVKQAVLSPAVIRFVTSKCYCVLYM